MKIRKILTPLAVSAIAMFGALPPAQAVIMTDIIMMVDESGSMGNVQTNLRNNIGAFASILSAGGVNAQYGLVGYGNSSVVPRMVTNLTTPTSFATAAAGLGISGGTEPGYIATAFALNALDGQSALFSFRTGALKNIIIFTDEPSNGDTAARGAVGGSAVTLGIVDALLTNNNALFNAVLRNTNTINSYKPLADAHSGNVYDLNGLNTTNQTIVTAFVDSFAQSKLKEIVDFCTANPSDPACHQSVPEPATLALMGLGLAGLGTLRRRKIA